MPMSSDVFTAEQAYSLLPRGLLPARSRIAGLLDFSDKTDRSVPQSFPDHLSVDALDLSGQEITALPKRLKCYELNLSRTTLMRLPHDLHVASRLDLSGCERLEMLPDGLTVGSLFLRNCPSLRHLPEGL